MVDVFKRAFVPLLLLSAAGIPDADAASLSKDWKRLDSPNFMGFGNASERDLRRVLRELEGFRSAFAILLPGIRLTSDVPTHLVPLNNTSNFAQFAPRNAKGKRLEGAADRAVASVAADHDAGGKCASVRET